MEILKYEHSFCDCQLHTGYGWWEIMFLDSAAIEDANGHSCDDWDDCDAYIKVYIDGREVYRSDTKYNNHMPYFGETYKSPKMLKKARIRIELYDEDSGWMQSSDDLILRWDTVKSIFFLLSKIKNIKNEIFV